MRDSEYDKAIECVIKCIDLDPLNYTAWLALAACNMQVLGRLSGYNSSLESLNSMYDQLSVQLRHVLVLNPWAIIASTWVRFLKRTAITHPDREPPYLLTNDSEKSMSSDVINSTEVSHISGDNASNDQISKSE